MLFLFGAASFLKNHWIQAAFLLQMRELSFRGGTDLPKVTLLPVGGEAWSLGPRVLQPALWSCHPTAGLATCSLEPPGTHRHGALVCRACPAESRVGILGVPNG